jgi:hypothetical protein
VQQDDDEIIQALEDRLLIEEPVLRSNRGFWLVVGALALVCVVVVVEIFANRPIANAIGTAQHDLRVAQDGAARVFAETGTYQDAGAEGLTDAAQGDAPTYVAANTPSDGLGVVSVYATPSVWAAAVYISPGACFYLKLEEGAPAPLYGVGTVCTATRALDAKDDRW